MNEIKRIVGRNLIILLGYTLYIRFISWGDSASIALQSAGTIFIHVIINIINGFNYRGENGNETSNAFFLSSGVVLVVGFSSCLANVAF